MNNKKIIFGIVLFLAICFLAFTFANPLEQGDGNGTLIQNDGNSANSGDTTDDGKEVKSISFSSSLKTKIAEGESVSLNPVIFPSTALDKSLVYSTSNSSVLSVDQNGLVTGVGKGTATITVTSSNGKKNTITFIVGEDSTVADNNNNSGINVNPSYPVGGNNNNNNNGSNNGNNHPSGPSEIYVDSVSISSPVSKLIIGRATTVSHTVSPSNATNKSVTYSSSNNNVLTVDQNGNVTAKGVGTATIIVTSSNGKTSSVVISVVDNMLSNVTASLSSGNNNITGLTSFMNGNTVYVEGSMDSSIDSSSGITFRISVPSVYTAEMLSNFSYSVGDNDFGIAVGKGTETIRNISSVESGNAYLLIDIPFDKYAIERSEAVVTVYIDWLGTGKTVGYTFNLNNIEVK